MHKFHFTEKIALNGGNSFNNNTIHQGAGTGRVNSTESIVTPGGGTAG